MTPRTVPALTGAIFFASLPTDLQTLTPLVNSRQATGSRERVAP